MKANISTIFRVGTAFLGSFALGIIILAIFLHYVGFDQVIETMSGANLQIMLLALCLDVLGLVLYGAGWYTVIRGVGLKMRFAVAECIAMTGIFTCYITPSGVFMDASRVLLASRETRIRLGQSAATVIIHKILFTLGFMTFAIIGSTMLLGQSRAANAFASNVLLIVAVIFLGIVAVAIMILKPEKLERLAERPLNHLSSMLGKMTGKHQEYISNSLETMFSDFRTTFVKALRNPKTLLASYVLMLLYWTTSVSILYLVFIALGYEVPIWVPMLTIAIGDFIQMTPIAIPGMIGILEVVFTSVLVTLGVPLSIAASATVLARIATFWFDLPITGAAASYYGVRSVLTMVSSLGKAGSS